MEKNKPLHKRLCCSGRHTTLNGQISVRYAPRALVSAPFKEHITLIQLFIHSFTRIPILERLYCDHLCAFFYMSLLPISRKSFTLNECHQLIRRLSAFTIV